MNIIWKHNPFVLAIGLISFIFLSGCSQTSRLTGSGNVDSANRNVTGSSLIQNTNTTSHPSAQNQVLHTSISLPNGQTVTPGHAVRWKDLLVSLQIQGIPAGGAKYIGIVGNHSTILSHSTVSTPVGTATLVLNKRTPPAASMLTAPTYEYWAIVYGWEYAYCIDASVIGNRKNAKSEMMELLSRWRIPSILYATHVPVTISKACRHVKLAQAVRRYLEHVSDPAVFKHFTILKVTYGNQPLSDDRWTVTLQVEHQPHKMSAYNEGINSRYIDFTVQDGQYLVTGLATG